MVSMLTLVDVRATEYVDVFRHNVKKILSNFCSYCTFNTQNCLFYMINSPRPSYESDFKKKAEKSWSILSQAWLLQQGDMVFKLMLLHFEAVS